MVNAHMTLDLKADELLLAQKQQESGGDGPSICREIWAFVVWTKVHMTLEDLEVDELMLAQRRQVDSGDERGTFEGTRG